MRRWAARSWYRDAGGIVAVALTAGCASAASPIVSQNGGTCPPAPDEKPYSVSVSNRSGDTASLARRQAIANALATAWGSDEDREARPARYYATMRELESNVPRTPAYLMGKARLRAGDSATVLLTYRRGQIPELDFLSSVRPELHRLISHALGKAVADAINDRAMRDTMPLSIPGSLGEAMLQVQFGWTPPTDGAVATFALRERAPRLVPGSSRMRYPDEYRQRAIEGSVLVGFVITQEGRADQRSVRVISSDGELFTRSVREFLTTARFDPLTIDCVAYPTVVSQPFNFALTP
jgi:TonB family protein